MADLAQLISTHQDHAHWLIFGSLILAGFNIPISIDLVMIASALLAAQVIPEKWLWLFGFSLCGCLIAGWISYWLGRIAGPQLIRLPLLRKTMNPARIEKTKMFYQKYGLWTFMIGRFIPFGVRNCIFMTSGLSRMSFKKFLVYDFVACTIWATSAFFLFYYACANYSSLITHVKIANIAIFTTFALVLISLLWYKKRKKLSK